jgi:hypothetical protein
MANIAKNISTVYKNEGVVSNDGIVQIEPGKSKILTNQSVFHIAYSNFVTDSKYNIYVKNNEFDNETTKNFNVFELEVRVGLSKDTSENKKTKRTIKFVKCIGYEDIKLPLVSIKLRIYSAISKESFLYIISIKENREIYALIASFCLSNTLVSINKYSKLIENKKINEIVDNVYNAAEDRTIFFGDSKMIKLVNNYLRSFSFSSHSSAIKIVAIIYTKSRKFDVEWSNGYYFIGK